MNPAVANLRRCVSVIVFSFLAGTAAGQSTPPEGIRQPMPQQFDRRQAEQQMEELNRHIDEIRSNFLSDTPTASKVKKTVRAVNDAVDGMTIAIMLGGVIIIALIGLFVIKRMRPSAYASNRPLDDPRIRLLLADMEAEGQKARAKAEKEPVGQHLASTAFKDAHKR
jgi:uncharacterized protein YneF (UPF0154 family)